MKHQVMEAAEVETTTTGQTEAPAKPKKEPIPVEMVTMTDGRVVEFAGKKKFLKDYFLTENGEIDYIVLDFRNGETRKIFPNPALIGRFAGHGMIQKYGDEAAGLEDIDDIILAVDELDGRLQKGEWSTQREGGGMSGTSVLIKALMEYGNRTLDQVKTFLSNKTKADKDALAINDKKIGATGQTIKAIVDRLKAEKVSKAAKVDTDSMLEGL